MPSRRRRWLVNIGFAILIAAALNVVLIATGQWGDTWFAEPIATLVVGTWLTFVYWVMAPSLVALLVLEGALRRPRTAPRATAILLGVTVAVVYMALLVLAFD